jgi:hypothetical protein
MTNADSIHAEALKQKDKYWEGISDRTRTLCLGTLVLIWGILSQKVGESGLTYAAHTKSDLLKIAACAVIVLALDYIEYLAAFGYRCQQGGEKIPFKRFRYDLVERTARIAKVALGAVALVALCMVLSGVVSIVHAAENADPDKFFGTWCGGDWNEGKYSCLRVTRPQGYVVVEFNFQGHDDWINCEGISLPTENILQAVCGRAETQSVWQNDSRVAMHLSIEHDDGRVYEDDRSLVRQ